MNLRTLLVLAGLAEAAVAKPTLFYDRTIPQAAFAAGEIVRAGASMPEFGLDRLGKVDCAPCLVTASGPAQSAETAKALKVGGPKETRAQSYTIRRSGNTIAALGADAEGAMYGGMDLAEAVKLGTIATLADSDHAPRIERRGIKFNAPLDARTPSYSDNSDSAQANIPEMWSFDFWREFLDEMARSRYNVLSLWNLHPFPSMVKVPEYPDVALEDVKRTRYRQANPLGSRLARLTAWLSSASLFGGSSDVRHRHVGSGLDPLWDAAGDARRIDPMGHGTGSVDRVIAFTASAWRRNWWRLPGRVSLTAVCLAALGAALWLHHWDLLGWNH